MNKSFLIAGVLALVSSAFCPADDEIFLRQTILDSVPLPTTVNRAYRLLPPANLSAATAGQKFPLVVYLHGGNARGEDNTLPVNELFPKLLATPELREKFPCFLLVPQCRDGESADGRPNNWTKWQAQKDAAPALWTKSDDDASDQLRAAMAAVEDVAARQPVDRSRIYLAGVSMGATGAWWWAAKQPEKFAGLLTVCGLSEACRAESLAKVPVWTFHGAKDGVIPVQRTRDLVAALKTAGGTVNYTEYPEGDHAIGEQALRENDFAAVRWLFDQQRK